MEQKILIIQTAFLGDLLLGIPLIKRIRKNYPNAHITLLCKKPFGFLFSELNLVQRLIEIDKNQNESWKKIEVLYQESFDILISAHRSFRSNLIAKKIKAKTKIGFKRFWNGFVFNLRVPYKKLLPDAIRQLSLLSGVDGEIQSHIETFEERYARINLSQEVFKTHGLIPNWADMDMTSEVRSLPQYSHIKEHFNLPDGPLYIFAPGSVWETKRWRRQGFIQVGHTLAQKGTVVIIGTQSESSLCQSIAQNIPKCINLAGQTTLSDLLCLMAQSEVIICNDSGAMHLASLVKLKTISLFGPTVLSFGYLPWNNQAIVLQKTLSCRPCGKHGHHQCPIGTHECMRKISAQDVLNSL